MHACIDPWCCREAAHNPLTLAEKKSLIVQINKLPPDKMEQVLLIINSVLPAKDQESVQQSNSNDIEIPLEILDTFTLRKLQQFVEVYSWHGMMKSFYPSFIHSWYRSIRIGGRRLSYCSDNRAIVVVVPHDRQ